MLNEANIKTHSIPVIASIVKSNCKKWSSRSSLTDLKINIDGMAYPIFVPAKLTEAGLRKLRSLLDTVPVSYTHLHEIINQYNAWIIKYFNL